MLVNGGVTIYHKGLNEDTKSDTWTRYNYSNAWFFGGKGAGIRKGYENANDVEVRIPYDKNTSLNIKDFNIGDIIIQGTVTLDITQQKELKDYLIYNITSINDNTFGNNPHVHIGGK